MANCQRFVQSVFITNSRYHDNCRSFCAELLQGDSFVHIRFTSIVLLLVGIGAMLTLSLAPTLIFQLSVACLAIAIVVAVIGLVKRLRK